MATDCSEPSFDLVFASNSGVGSVGDSYEGLVLSLICCSEFCKQVLPCLGRSNVAALCWDWSVMEGLPWSFGLISIGVKLGDRTLRGCLH